MQVFNIPDNVISGVAAEIHSKTTKDYKIPVVGVPDNLETPQVFEIIPFDEIDKPTRRIYAVDGSRNSHTFFNGVSLCFYQAGSVCFRQGQQLRLNASDDPVVLGQVFHGTKMLVRNSIRVTRSAVFFPRVAARRPRGAPVPAPRRDPGAVAGHGPRYAHPH